MKKQGVKNYIEVTQVGQSRAVQVDEEDEEDTTNEDPNNDSTLY